METVVVIQGPTHCDIIERIKKGWGNIPIIFSTWEGQPKFCYSDDDIVVYNKKPADVGVGNLNMQVISSMGGFLKAKELGYKRVVKWRSDLIPNDGVGLLNLFEKDCFNFYSFLDDRDGYLADFFMEGELDEMINLFTIDNLYPLHAEVAFTNRMFELGLDKKANFICKKLSENGVDIFWHKEVFGRMGYWYSENVEQEQYKDYIIKK